MFYIYKITQTTLKSLFKINSTVRSLNYKRLFSQDVLNINTNLSKDIILFKYDNPRFFKVLNIFAISQFGFWMYLSSMAYTTLRDVPASTEDDAAWWKKVNLGESKYRNGITILAFLTDNGYGTLSISWMYTLRSVRYLVLHKGGTDVTFVTYGPFGKNRLLKVGLDHIACKGARMNAGSQLPVKVKNHYLHYILDMRGEFRNPALFDRTVGIKRMWK